MIMVLLKSDLVIVFKIQFLKQLNITTREKCVLIKKCERLSKKAQKLKEKTKMYLTANVTHIYTISTSSIKRT